MSVAFLFWLLMILWVVLGIFPAHWPITGSSFRPLGGSLLLFILIALLGYQVFGPILRH